MNNQNTSVFVDPQTKEKLTSKGNTLVSSTSIYNCNNNNIPNLIFPSVLAEEDQHSKNFYQGRAQQYDDTLHLTFFTHSQNEENVRESFIDKLKIRENSKVLEIACGTGRDSVLIAKRLSSNGELHVQDISEDMINLCYDKLKELDIKKSFCLSNAIYLPYEDNYFDATYSFGAMGEFSDKKQAIKEMVRVTKPGGKIVFGDESVPVWLRNTIYYKILITTNPMFSADPPFNDIPVEARNVNIQWVIGSTFYLMDFEVGDGEPTANFDFEIPGVRGGTYRTRFEGALEGVKKKTKELAYQAAKAKGLSMHDWLDSIVSEKAKKDLNITN
ncbi:MAG: class I SAM-dependent methyltransferase [Sphingobacteriia bacterium]|jgi:ubiquinone/menaquinone biosynthesis C-methylase UbiE